MALSPRAKTKTFFSLSADVLRPRTDAVRICGQMVPAQALCLVTLEPEPEDREEAFLVPTTAPTITAIMMIAPTLTASTQKRQLFQYLYQRTGLGVVATTSGKTSHSGCASSSPPVSSTGES